MQKKTTPKKTTPKKKKNARLPYVIIRAHNAGVHAGELAARNGTSVTLHNARRIWYWSGAASLSELAVYGAKNPSACKFGVCIAVQEIIGDVCEIIHCQPAGEKMIREQVEWRV
jgi:hypothetical protein